MRTSSFLLSLGLLMGLAISQVGCEKIKSMMGRHESEHGTEHGSEKIKVVRASEQGKDIRIPEQIWDVVSGLNFENAVTQGATFVFSPIRVMLKEKNPGVLVEPQIEFEFPRGGGEINLSRWVTGKAGSFFVKFDYAGFEEPDLLSVLYISQARRRKLDGQVYGAGCNSFYDVKKYLLQENGKDGLTVNTTRDRHITVLGGNFIFAHKKAKQAFITQVTFTDSEKPEYFCDFLTQIGKPTEEGL
ncbi:MAG: hypothetical protein BroJett040_21810 [Oligoflexia bacterium]|nr:MAG: hypothetical protein BroJett040_21810 [Oligoflexia bacterium]